MPPCTDPRRQFRRLQAVLNLSRHYATCAAVVTMARRANAPVPGMPELDAAALERFRRIRSSLLLGAEVPDVTAELSAFFYATHRAMCSALTPEVEAYARERVAALGERKRWLLRHRREWAVGEDTLLWRQIEEELREIDTELGEYGAFVSFVHANTRRHGAPGVGQGVARCT